MTFDEFKQFYLTYGRCPNDVSKRKNPMNERQLQSRYKKYLSSREKQFAKKRDTKWDELKSQMDLSKCRFMSILEGRNEHILLNILKQNSGGLYKIIDPAHVFSRGSFSHMKYDRENVVPLNRYSHDCLDSRRHPVSGVSISDEEVEDFWLAIVGKERYTALKEKSKKRGVNRD